MRAACHRIHVRTRAPQDLSGYASLIDHWMTNRYTLRYSGGLVPDVYQQFTKRQGVFSNPTSPKSPAKLRLAFEAAPFGARSRGWLACN